MPFIVGRAPARKAYCGGTLELVPEDQVCLGILDMDSGNRAKALAAKLLMPLFIVAVQERIPLQPNKWIPVGERR